MSWSGRVIDGRYVVESEIGSGATGVVLRAHHQFTGAHVAVKVLRPQVACEPEVQTRFLAEARAANAISHPGIVRVLDAGRTKDELYMVMELLEGESLRAPMDRGTCRPAEIHRILLALLDVLVAAHAKGFVHRDLKPENVFLLVGGGVKLLDFGIAKVLDGSSAQLTAVGMMLGSPAYMAPEQLDASKVDARADLWAVGAILYEALTNETPFGGRTIHELLGALATKQPTSIRTYLPAAPRELVAWFDRALARYPEDRFQSATEMARSLAALSLDVTARPSAERIRGHASTLRDASGSHVQRLRDSDLQLARDTDRMPYEPSFAHVPGTTRPWALPQITPLARGARGTSPPPSGAEPKPSYVGFVITIVALFVIGIGAAILAAD